MVPPPVDLLHRPLSAIVRTYGTPAAVATKDDGQHVAFTDGAARFDAIVDDDGTVHAFDVALPPGTTYTVDVDGTRRRFTFGATTSLGARDELAASAETEGPNFRVFRQGPGSAVVLAFDPKSSLLARVVVGDRATLLRLGYVREGTPQQAALVFIAPKLRHSAVADGSGAHATVVRLDLDRGGVVRNTAIVVPSDDEAFDADLLKRVAHDAYAPAMLGGRGIGASVLREIRH